MVARLEVRPYFSFQASRYRDVTGPQNKLQPEIMHTQNSTRTNPRYISCGLS